MTRQCGYQDRNNCQRSPIAVEGGRARAPAPAPHGALTTEGIEGAAPRRYTFERATSPAPPPDPRDAGIGRRKPPREHAHQRNPLNPDYRLPPLPPPPVMELPFLRDTLDVADIAPRRPPPRARASDPRAAAEAAAEAAEAARRAPRDPPRDAGLRVADIAVPRRPAPPAGPARARAAEAARVEAGVGAVCGAATWRREHYAAARATGGAGTAARADAAAALAGAAPAALPAALRALTDACEALDRDGSGRLTPRELGGALAGVAGLGLAPRAAAGVAAGLAPGGEGGLISWHSVVGALYDAAGDALAAAASSAGGTAPPLAEPLWVEARRRRVKTAVGAALGQQPVALAAAAAHARTPQEAADAARRSGRRIEGLARAGEGGAPAEAFWFADAGAAHAEAGGGGGGADSDGGAAPAADAFWFAQDGADAEAARALEAWRPHDDPPAAPDLRRQRKGRGSGGGGGGGGGSGGGGSAPPPRPDPPSPAPSLGVDSAARRAARADVDLVRALA
jgi:hypothetical protein